MIQHPAYGEPWAVRETELQVDVLAQSDSAFALARGHIGRVPLRRQPAVMTTTAR